MRPLIGVTTSEVRLATTFQQTEQGEPRAADLESSEFVPRQEMVLGLTYMDAIKAAGGVPMVVPPLEPPALADLLAGLDGVVLSGGPDIDPVAYHERPHPALGPTWRDLDRTELMLAREAVAGALPILAICRGAQALNVAHGGTLIQHLPDEVGTRIQHRQRGVGSQAAHTVTVEVDSKLAGALGCTEVEVNSYHHQSPKELGEGLQAVARAEDGVIEGLEMPARDFVVGIQWHAEAMPEAPHSKHLFRSFVEAAAREPAGAQAS
jgi:putative glutamine amidotransferase